MRVGRLVGRQHEWGVILDRIDALPSSAVVLIEGEPGIGKTALLDAAVAEASARGVQVFRCTGDDVMSGRPYGMVAGQLVPLSLLDDRHSAPVELVEELRDMEVNRPSVLAIDDLQWADSTSLPLLVQLTRDLVQQGAVVLLAFRSAGTSAELHRALDRLDRLQPVHLALGPLGADESVALAEATLGRPLGERLHRLVGGAGGNPFFIRSLLQSPSDSGSFAEHDSAVEVPAAQLPGAIRGVLLRRAAVLSDDTYALLRSASVLGRRFQLELLRDLSDSTDGSVALAVTEAADAGLLESGEGTDVVFRHDLVREALYDDLMPGVRERLHRRVIELLESQKRPPGELIPHLLKIAMADDDVDMVLRVAPFGTSAAYLALLERVDAVAGDADRHRIAMDRIDALSWAGRFDEVIVSADGVLAQGLAPPLAVVVGLARLRVRAMLGQTQLAIDEYQRAPVDAPPGLRAAEAVTIAFGAAGTGRDSVRARIEAERALALGADPGCTAVAHIALAWADHYEGQSVRALEHISAALEAIQNDSTPMGRAAGCHLVAATIHLSTGDHHRALESVRLDDEHGLDASGFVRQPYRHVLRTIIDIEAGRWSEARAELDGGRSFVADTGFPIVRDWLHHVADVLDLYERGAGAVGDRPDEVAQPHLGSHWRMLRDALLAELRQQPLDALTVLRPVLDRGSPLCDRPAVVLCLPRFARLAAENERIDDVRAATTVARSLLASEEDAGAITTVTWVAALHDGDFASLEQMSQACSGEWPLRAAMLLDDAARIAAREGAASARELGRRAVRAYQQLGAGGLETALRDALARRGISVRLRRAEPRPSRGWGALTAAEERVVDRVTAGRTTAEIAAELVVSRRTVESHLRNVYAKLGCTNRVQLVTQVLERKVSSRG